MTLIYRWDCPENNLDPQFTRRKSYYFLAELSGSFYRCKCFPQTNDNITDINVYCNSIVERGWKLDSLSSIPPEIKAKWL